ncbi:hypothetical protein NM688_g4844 [Phlebia brevispora]|uniref:Uncharacterized protein n=1 Tax=Phlebia brevispora TaxID=194682 RepID=A0ACC1T1S4_9APHY|nr:hypothetical protein NM688_g4844 [Phlebia brevispora]
MSVRESRPSPPSGFVHGGPAHPDTSLDLRIALVQNNPEGLINALYEVSTPGSPSYGEHLSKEETESFVAPSPKTVDAVNTWLSQAGLNASKITPTGDWLSINIPVGTANELFDADFSVFTHSATGTQTVRTLQYSIPSKLVGHLDFVHPTISFPSPHTRGRPVAYASSSGGEQLTPTSCDTFAVTPHCVQTIYNIPTTLATQSSNQLGVTAYLGQYANQADLTAFMEVFRSDIKSKSATTFKLTTLDKGQNPQNGRLAGVEGNTDTQYTVGLASGVPVTFISVGPQNSDGDLFGLLDTANYLLSQSNPPHVITTSYGSDEPDISLPLANSGDGGVGGGAPGETCGATFLPTFPSGCPYITLVGATSFASSSSHTEVGASFSSGGFSNYFGTPSYQAPAVKSYLSSLGSTYKGKYNASGRAYPDVAAIGTNIVLVIDDQLAGVDGTSPASPMWASIVALLNDQLISHGKKPLGFLNPWLYANPSAFHDVTSGSNPGCNTNGFPATKGWDPVTGLGTPNFAALKTAAGL